MKQILVILTLLTGLISCINNNISKVCIIAKINIYETPEENEEVGHGFMLFDYADQVKKQFPLIDLKNITYQIFRQSSNDEVTFRLTVSNTALVYSDKMADLFDSIIKKKMDEHRDHKNKFKEVIVLSNSYSQLIDTKNIDSIWSSMSSDVKTMITKNDFNKVLLQKDSLFHPKGNRKISSRQYCNSLKFGAKDLKQDFYVINYSYDDGSMEQITLQGDSLKFAGFRFYPSRK
jgi:hypothetical protein